MAYESTHYLAYMAVAPEQMARGVLLLLAALLLAASWFDWRQRRIPNALVLAGTLCALLLHAVLPPGEGFVSAIPGGLGLLTALAGWLVALLVMLPFYAIRAMGAGDVKLLAMLGAFLGPLDIWWALLATAFAGGILAILLAVRRGVMRQALQNLWLMISNPMLLRLGGSAALPNVSAGSAATLPYGIAIGLGSMAWLIARGLAVGLI